jgi:uncharacterized metal-binding protein
MPSGKTHDRIAIILLAPIYLILRYFVGLDFVQSLILSISILFSQLMFGPDLDLLSVQYKRWGPLKFIWLPYRMLFTHRSRFTHGIILGPITRIIYLSIILVLIESLLNYFWNVNFLDINTFSLKNIYMLLADKYFLALVLGLFTGAAIHTLTDKVAGFFKDLF